MILNPGYFFKSTASGTNLLALSKFESTSSSVRSEAVLCPALSTISIYISGSASVNVISNPFDGTPSGKDKVLTTITSSGTYTVASSQIILLDVTVSSGSVSARVVLNED